MNQLEKELENLLSRRRSKVFKELREISSLKGDDFSLSNFILDDPTLCELYSEIFDQKGIKDLEKSIYETLDSNEDLFKRKVLEKMNLNPNLLDETEY